MENVEHFHLAFKRESRLRTCVSVVVRLCTCVRQLQRQKNMHGTFCILFLSHPDPSRFYCNVTLIYVAPYLHQPTMSTLWKIYAAVHIKCDHINALMNAFSSISLNKMTPIQSVTAAISKRYGMPGMLIGLAFDSGPLPVLHKDCDLLQDRMKSRPLTRG